MSIAFEEPRTLASEEGISALDEVLSKPADKKIADGEALRGRLAAGSLLAVEVRLEKAFGIINSDQSREAGECIAYGLGLDAVDETVVDHHLIFQATALLSRDTMGCIIGNDLAEGDDQKAVNLWTRRTRERDYMLRKHLGHIILDDNTVEPNGIVYSLLSTLR